MRRTRRVSRNTSAPEPLQWDTARAQAVDQGLRRMAERGLLSETHRRQLCARLESLPVTPTAHIGQGADLRKVTHAA